MTDEGEVCDVVEAHAMALNELLLSIHIAKKDNW